MDCNDARKVWGHPEGFIGGLKEYLPGTFECIAENVRQAKGEETNPFLETIRKKVGDTITIPFFASHAEEGGEIAKKVHDVVGDLAGKAVLEQYFSRLYEAPIYLGNICCDGSHVSFGRPLFLEEAVCLQMAAITTGPDGEDL